MGKAQNLDDAFVERDGFGSHITEVGPFLNPSDQLGHDIISHMDIILHCSSVSVSVIHIYIVILLDSIQYNGYQCRFFHGQREGRSS